LGIGTPVHVVSEMLGHSSPAVTLGIYAHVIPGDQEDAAARLDAVLGA
jgi:integrase